MLEDIDKSEVKLTDSIILHKEFLRKKNYSKPKTNEFWIIFTKNNVS